MSRRVAQTLTLTVYISSGLSWRKLSVVAISCCVLYSRYELCVSVARALSLFLSSALTPLSSKVQPAVETTLPVDVDGLMVATSGATARPAPHRYGNCLNSPLVLSLPASSTSFFLCLCLCLCVLLFLRLCRCCCPALFSFLRSFQNF